MSDEVELLKDLQDSGWNRTAFFIKGNITTPVNARIKGAVKGTQYMEGQLNFSSTALGGNRAVNPLPQYTESVDPRMDQIIYDRDSSRVDGMGEAYFEDFEVNQHRIYMQFGIPKHNSLTSFWGDFFSPGMGALANRGDPHFISGKVARAFGVMLGYVVIMPVLPILGVATLISKVYRSIVRAPLNTYYYMAPTMPLYYSVVNNFVNAWMVYAKMSQGMEVDTYSEAVRTGSSKVSGPDAETASVMREVSKVMPYLFPVDNDGVTLEGIDVRRLSSNYQTKANAHFKKLKSLTEDKTNEEAYAAIEKLIAEYRDGTNMSNLASVRNKVIANTEEYYETYTGGSNPIADLDESFSLGSFFGDGDGEGEDNSATAEEAKARLSRRITEDAVKGSENMRGSAQAASDSLRPGAKSEEVSWGFTNWFRDLFKHTEAELADGSAFVCLNVDYVKTVSEGYNSSTRTSSLADQVNETSSSARSATFNLAGGNIGDNVAFQAMEWMARAASNVMEGMLDTVGLSGVKSLMGSGQVDIPEYWESTEFEQDDASYTVKLRTPYPNPLGVLMDIIIPLGHIVAGGCARSTGKNSYTGPFICKLWDQGKHQFQRAMITSISISRGEGGVGWNSSYQATGIDVTFTVKNLSTMMHMPITTGFSLSDVTGFSAFDEDTMFTDYMAVLSGMGIAEQHYHLNRWKLNQALGRQRVDAALSSSRFVQEFAQSGIGSLISAVYRESQTVQSY